MPAMMDEDIPWPGFSLTIIKTPWGRMSAIPVLATTAVTLLHLDLMAAIKG
jgi:hypothetical protein